MRWNRGKEEESYQSSSNPFGAIRRQRIWSRVVNRNRRGRACGLMQQNLQQAFALRERRLISLLLIVQLFELEVGAQLFEVNLSPPQLLPLEVNRTGAFWRQADLRCRVLDQVSRIGQRAAANLVVAHFSLLLVLRADHLEPLAVHLRLRVEVVAEHGLTVCVRLEVGAEESLTFNLSNKSSNRLSLLILEYSYLF